MFHSRSLLLPFAACLLLFALTRLHYDYWPLSWPDEALFSSPAAELVTNGVFATKVLEGLMPGMESATLWNSPLFMMLLSGVYYFTGESLLVARTVALFCGFGALFVFFIIARRIFRSLVLPGALTLLLVGDPTFQRAANTARMDMLTLLFLLGALYFVLRAHSNDPTGDSKAGRFFFLAGLCAGLAGLSHPGGILAVPVILIFAWPANTSAIKNAGGRILLAALGTLLGIAPWLFYILPNLEIFQIQFLSQIERKLGMLEAATGGDTGGVIVVFFSQYGGTRALMIVALAVLTLTFGAGLVRFAAGFARPATLRQRLFIAFAVTTALVILASEAWYALYVGPFWLLTIGLLLEDVPEHTAVDGSIRWPAWLSFLERWNFLKAYLPRLLKIAGLVGVAFFIVAPAYFTIRHRLVLQTPTQIEHFEKQVINAAATCSAMYLRVRPDPYFRLRENYPNMEVLEFVPGKLQIGGKGDFFQERYAVPDFATYLERRYDSIDCFLLDDHGDWEPLLTAYLDRNRAAFSGLRISARAPLEPVTLWRRR